jgi:hypothetical protein
MSTPENTKLCDFTSTNNNDFICTPIAPPALEANFYEIKPALLKPVNDRAHVDPNNVPLASLVAQEEHVDVNFIRNNNFNNSAYMNNFGSNNYRSYPSTNGNGYGSSYGNSSNNNRSAPSDVEVMIKDFISKQTAFNKSIEKSLVKLMFLLLKLITLLLMLNF